MKIKKLSLTVFLFLFGAGMAMADITVVSVKGTAACSTGSSWEALEAGAKIKEGSKISTGIKSVVVLKLANSTVTLQPLSMMKIYEDRITPDSSDTRIALRRGGLKAEVNKMKEVKTVFKVATPVSTSSVRGTIQEVSTGPYGTTFRAPEGSISVESRKGGNARVISRKLVYSQKNHKNTPEDIKGERGIVIVDANLPDEERDAFRLVGDDSPDGVSGISDVVFDAMGIGTVDVGLDWRP